eukprot:767418-Hanusia_phi.AAC.1
MSRRPPSDIYNDLSGQAAPATATRSIAPSRNPAPARSFHSSFRSPFTAPSQDSGCNRAGMPGMSALLDFKEGIEIVDDAPEPLAAELGTSFMDYNGRVSSRAASLPAPETYDDELDGPADVTVTSDDIRHMIEENLRRNCVRRTPQQSVSSVTAATSPTVTAATSPTVTAAAPVITSAAPVVTAAATPGTLPRLQAKIRAAPTHEKLIERLQEQGKMIEDLQKELHAAAPAPTISIPAPTISIPAPTISIPVGSPALPESRMSRLTMGNLQAMIHA